jgi:anaerobic C4-dicarboxylate transporter
LNLFGARATHGYRGQSGRLAFNRMEPAMTKSKTFAAALAALTLAAAFAGSEAQARPRFGVGLGVGLAAGALIGAAAASSAYAAPAYYRDCRYVERYDRWGNLRVVKVCEAVPY